MPELDQPLDRLTVYRYTYRARAFEVEMSRVFAAGHMAGWLHSARGQELTGSVLGLLLHDGDSLIPSSRSRAAVLARGIDLYRIVAEMLGREDGVLGGRGKEHFADRDRGVLGTTGIIGATMPLAAGAGLACELKDPGTIAVATFGDGAVAQGSFHESLNVTSLWKLPVVFVCENNGYAEMTPVRRALAQPEIARHAEAYGMPGERCDGYDEDSVTAALAKAINRAREGGGPSLVEVQTYRWGGHFEGDAQTYRTKKEVESWIARDFLPVMRQRLLSTGTTESDIAAAETAVTQEVTDAVSRALSARKADTSGVFDYVYFEPDSDRPAHVEG